MTVEEIKRQKRLLGYSNAQLSDISGVPLGTVNKILSGETKSPRYDTLQALSRAVMVREGAQPFGLFGVSDEDLLLRDELTAQKVPPGQTGKYTIADLENLPEGIMMELIDGVLYEMCVPKIRHQSIIASLFRQIDAYIRENNGKCIPFLSPTGVRLDRDQKTLVAPDLFILCNPEQIDRESGYVDGGPDFVAEVISPSTSSKDYIKKAAKYEAAGVKEYWIIDPIKEHLLVYEFMNDGVPQIQPLTGKRGIAIYQGELKIDLDQFAEIIKRGY